MKHHYHNTTASSGRQLGMFEARARTQEERILELFRARPFPFTPSQVRERVLPNAPITSVRRAITNLTRDGKLRKTTHQVTGPYGQPEYCWVLAGVDNS